jgi:dolichol-phosphate mannosyltransferase
LKTLVVIPTYNERATIASVISGLSAAVPDAAVLVVDDGSPDGTADLVESLALPLGPIDVLRRPVKSGLGSAYRDGFAWGLAHGFDVLVEMDADLSHDPRQLPQLLAAIDEGADLVIGSRYVSGGSIPKWSKRRRLLSRLGNQFAAAALGLGAVCDSTSGYRAFRADAVRRLELDTTRADGYGFQIETAWRVRCAGGHIVEVPITFVDRTQGESKMSLRIVVEALALVTWWGLRQRLTSGAAVTEPSTAVARVMAEAA